MIPSILRAFRGSVHCSDRNPAFLLGLVVAVAQLTGCWTDIPLDPTIETHPANRSDAPPASVVNLNESPAPQNEDSPTISDAIDPAEPTQTLTEQPNNQQPQVGEASPHQQTKVTLPQTKLEADDLFADVPPPAGDSSDVTDISAPQESQGEQLTIAPQEPIASETGSDTKADSSPFDWANNLFESALDESPEQLTTAEQFDSATVHEQPPASIPASPLEEQVAAPPDSDIATTVKPKEPNAEQSQQQDSPEFLLPWETETPPEAADPASSEPSEAPSTDGLPWKTFSNGSGDATADDSVGDASYKDSGESSPLVAAQPVDKKTLVWQFGSRLSYLLIAPDADLDAARDELQGVVASLDIEMPKLDAPITDTPAIDASAPDASQKIKRLLAVGRDLGSQLEKKYGAEYASIVEMAFKSNLLLATNERPHLKHAVTGSVAAAAVRSGVPQSVWKPWQQRVAESVTTAEIIAAVTDFHTQVGDHFQQSSAIGSDTMPPVLR